MILRVVAIRESGVADAPTSRIDRDGANIAWSASRARCATRQPAARARRRRFVTFRPAGIAAA
jgi:hypothetical protein